MGRNGIIGINTKMLNQALYNEKMVREERQWIKDWQASEALVAKGAVAAMDEMRERPTAAMIMDAVRNLPPMGGVETEVLIVNRTTAAALRKQLSPETSAHIEMIITDAAETGTVYQVTNDELRKELLRSIAAGRREAQ